MQLRFFRECSIAGDSTPAAIAGLLQGVEARVKRPEYARLLADCQAQYCGARLGLVEPVVRQRVAAFARQPLPTLTRSGCAHLMQVSRMTHGRATSQRLRVPAGMPHDS